MQEPGYSICTGAAAVADGFDRSYLTNQHMGWVET